MLTYPIEERGPETKTDFLVRVIKNDILDGILKENYRMPSKRSFAEHLGVSVITVERAYGILADEGYLRARERSGFYVEGPSSFFSVRPTGGKSKGARSGIKPAHLNFTPDLPPEEYNPLDDERLLNAYRDSTAFKQLQRIIRRLLNEQPQFLSVRTPTYGMHKFRQAIASYLRRFRGMEINAEQVIIGAGSEYLYSHIVGLFGRDKLYAIEDPCYKKIPLIYKSRDAEILPLAMGPDGIRSDELFKCHADVLHVSPFNSYPSGVTAPPYKREEYIGWAEKHNAFLVEDDFDSEFSYMHKPQQTMYARNRGERVIYMNTFSKSIAFSARIGYMVLPEALLEAYHERMGFFTCPVPVFDQMILTEFLNSGQFEKHLLRMRKHRET